jgi:glycosyltransferase involved in cell wall biosynthesis
VHSFKGVYREKIDLFLFSSDFMARKTEEFWRFEFKKGKLYNPFKIPEMGSPVETGVYGLYFGRMIEEKGCDVLLQALALVPEVPFKIIGDGPESDKLKQYAGKLHLTKIEFLSPKWGRELEEVLIRARFVVVPSVWHENFPYVILQSFAFMKPVIGSNRGGIPEMVLDGERGLVYNADDPRELSEKIKRLFFNGELCARMGVAARKYVEDNFRDDKFYQDLMDNYDKVLK